LLGYVWHSLTEGYRTAVASGDMKSYFGAYTGMAPDAALFKTVSVWGFQVPVAAYVAFLATFALNFWILARGVKGGIEVLSKYGMPILLLLAVGMTIWALSLGAPDPKHPEASVWNGMGFLWNPDLSRLGDFKVWMAATGQVLFTLSVGMGCIITYASYLRRQQDVVLSGLTSASTNTFVEVILGGSLVIPIAFAFLGPQEILSVASSGSFNLGFVTMPLMLGQVPMATLLALAWFALLFIAGVTSSVSMVESGIAFLQDELGWSRRKTVAFWAVVSFVLCQPAILGFAHGVVDEMDFWAGTLGLVVFALVEVILFAWVFGIDKAWDEMHHGAEMRVPEIYKFVLKYITPVFLGTVLVVWAWQQGLDVLLMTHVAPADQPWVLATRIGLVVFFVALAWVARRSLKQRDAQGGSV
jgi:neurotransmitter:Na+ symporter, NSS family